MHELIKFLCSYESSCGIGSVWTATTQEHVDGQMFTGDEHVRNVLCHRSAYRAYCGLGGRHKNVLDMTWHEHKRKIPEVLWNVEQFIVRSVPCRGDLTFLVCAQLDGDFPNLTRLATMKGGSERLDQLVMGAEDMLHMALMAYTINYETLKETK